MPFKKLSKKSQVLLIQLWLFINDLKLQEILELKLNIFIEDSAADINVNLFVFKEMKIFQINERYTEI